MHEVFGQIAERRIQEAMEEGIFDNLPGKGKPLDLDDDAMTAAYLRAASRVLRNAGLLPDWMQVDKEIDRAREENRRMLESMAKEYPRRRLQAAEALTAFGRNTAQGRTARPLEEFAAWLVRQRGNYLAAMRRVNSDITKLCLMAPPVPRVHVPYRIAKELASFDSAFPAPPVSPPQVAEEPQSRTSLLRQAASARYGADRERRDAL